jgi:histidyl-tRNA synthetase
MRDVTGDAYARVRRVADELAAHLRRGGYESVDTPLLEPTELFVRKSGGELTSRMYTFVDPGGRRVSLRPEFTSSVIRHFVQEGDALDRPVRWQYQGPVFRYEREVNGGYRQSTQVGAELIDASGPEADAEVLSLAWEGLDGIGIEGRQMRVGHVGLLLEVVRGCGLSEAAALFIIRNAPELKRGDLDPAALARRARDAGLLDARPDIPEAADLTSDGRRSAREYVRGVLAGATASPLGRRSPEQIVDRLMRKVAEADSEESFLDAASLIEEVVKQGGGPRAALESVRGTLARRIGGDAILEELGSLFDLLGSRGIDESRVVFDPGLVRELSYYTGVIFEISDTSGAPLCGGGRYDGLIRALGGADTPALGFAYTVDSLV